MEKLKNFLTKYWWLVTILLLIPACWALFVPGFYGASDDIHIAWLYELHRVILMGKIPPRFVPDLSFAFGYPLFNFVFPLPFYLAEILHLLGFNLVDSIKGLFFLSIPLSFLFMYLLLRQFISRSLSLAGAMLYIYAPYRAVDLYVRGAIGEVVSFIFLPLIILSIIKINNAKNLRWVGIGGIAISSLVLSHNITAYMFLPAAFLLILLQFFFTPDKKAFIAKSFLMIFMGCLVSIYFWLPAIIESGLMKYDTVFNFVDHFPTLLQLVTPYWGYGASVPGPGDGMSFFLGTANILVAILGLIIAMSFWSGLTEKVKPILIWAVISIVVSLFLMNYRSIFFWNRIPLLPYFQFPWRFLILMALTMPILIVPFEKFRAKSLIGVSIIILILITSAGDFRPQDFLGRQDNYFLNRYIPTPVASEQYLKTQEEYLRLPKNTQIRPDRNYSLVSSDAVFQLNKINDLDSIITVNTGTESKLDYNKYFFPGWIASIDGQQTEITAGQPFGQITVNVPPGSHSVKIAFEETNFRKLTDAISLGSFLVSLGMCFPLKFLKKIGR